MIKFAVISRWLTCWETSRWLTLATMLEDEEIFKQWHLIELAFLLELLYLRFLKLTRILAYVTFITLYQPPVREINNKG